MFTLNQLTLLALAGTTLAAPALHHREAWGGGWGHGGWHGHGGDSDANPTSTVWEYATEVVTVVGNAPQATSEPEATGWHWSWSYGDAPATTVTTTEAPATTTEAPVVTVTSTPEPTTEAAVTSTTPTTQWTVWTTSTTAAPAATTTASSGTGYLAIANKWRVAGGLPAFSESNTLLANALKTAQDSNGQLVHELNSGTFAQVLAPGNADNFESVYVGGWLCELPALAGLNGICASATSGWDHSNGETGHAEILSSTSYSKIGCALADGIWACDLA
ncbi:hypothetical protein DV735_g4869, partial [Chaetothyriales sp. CBS 134920]